MTALGKQHGVGAIVVIPHTAHKSVRGTVDSHRRTMTYRHYFAQFARRCQLLYFHKIRMIAHHMAHSHYHALLLSRLAYVEALLQSGRNGFFEKHMIAGFDGFDAGVEVHILAGAYHHRIGFDAACKEVVVVGEALLGRQAKAAGYVSHAYLVDVHHPHQSHLGGVLDKVFQIFVGAVARTYCYNFYRVVVFNKLFHQSILTIYSYP